MSRFENATAQADNCWRRFRISMSVVGTAIGSNAPIHSTNGDVVCVKHKPETCSHFHKHPAARAKLRTETAMRSMYTTRRARKSKTNVVRRGDGIFADNFVRSTASKLGFGPSFGRFGLSRTLCYATCCRKEDITTEANTRASGPSITKSTDHPSHNHHRPRGNTNGGGTHRSSA